MLFIVLYVYISVDLLKHSVLTLTGDIHGAIEVTAIIIIVSLFFSYNLHKLQRNYKFWGGAKIKKSETRITASIFKVFSQFNC